MMKFRKGNTLAEVMITLIILGVVASLTVPVLKKHTQREETAVKLKKGYMSLEQAIDAAIVDYGDMDKWTMGSVFKKYMVPELQSLRDCTSGGVGSCFPTTVSGMSGGAPNAAIVMMDGIAIANSGMNFFIDVNNVQPPNQMGVDVFQYTLELVGKNDALKEPGDWKFMPKGDAQKVMKDGWKITYW